MQVKMQNELLARFVMDPRKVTRVFQLHPFTLKEARGEFYLLPNGSKLCCDASHPRTFYVKGYSKRMFDMDLAWVNEQLN